MEPRPLPKPRRNWGPAVGCVSVIGALVACLLTLVLAGDGLCYTGLTQRMPVYPQATPIFRQYNWLRPYGMGSTVIAFETDDPEGQVRAFYGRAQGEYARRALQFSNPLEIAAENMTRAAYDVVTQEDGTGSQVILFGYCLQ